MFYSSWLIALHFYSVMAKIFTFLSAQDVKIIIYVTPETNNVINVMPETKESQDWGSLSN